jgi:hypothetical protein
MAEASVQVSTRTFGHKTRHIHSTSSYLPDANFQLVSHQWKKSVPSSSHHRRLHIVNVVVVFVTRICRAVQIQASAKKPS